MKIFFYILSLAAASAFAADEPALKLNARPLAWDISSFRENDLRTLGLCQNSYVPDGHNAEGVALKVLGVAAVYLAPGYGTSPAGHVGLRFVYCFGESLNDRLLEVTSFTKNEVYGFELAYPGVDHSELGGASTSSLA